jgi:hypothetical protein
MMSIARKTRNSNRLRGDADHVGVGQPDNAAIMGAHEIDRCLPPAKANDDLVVEIGVRRKSRPHALGA